MPQPARRRTAAVGAVTLSALVSLVVTSDARAATPVAASGTSASALGWHTCEPPAGGAGLASAAGPAGALGLGSAASPQKAGPASAPTAGATDAAFECASLSVPLDYDAPSGEQIVVAAIRHRATDPGRRIGSLFFNPGGPGGGGTTSLPLYYPTFPAELRARYDIVSFDPRGIGASTPLTCFDTPEQEQALLGQLPTGFPVGREQEEKQVAVFATFTAACAENGGPIQDHMSTANVARDLDRLRAAVGDRLLDYYGISYGTYLGATYANLFPERTGRMVLDGNVPPVEWNDQRAGSWDNTFTRLESPRASQRGLQEMMTQCGLVTTDRCSFSAGSPARTLAKYRTLLSRVSAAPVTVAGQEITYATVVASVIGGLVTQNDNPVTNTGWDDLADQLQAIWLQSEPGAVQPAPTPAPSTAPTPAPTAATDATPDIAAPLPEGLWGVLCSESPNPRDPDSYGQQARRVNETQSPDGFAFAWSWLAQPCAQWQGRDADRYTGPWNRPTRPLLLVGTVADSNTAYAGSQRMSVQLANARLLTQTGGGHTALLNRSDCIDRHTAAYIITGQLPLPGTVCDQNRKPF